MQKALLTLSLIGVGLFTTVKSQAANVPYNYGFETSDLDGWTIINGGSGNNWEVSQASSQTPPASEGDNYMLYYFDSNVANSYLFSKGINLEAGENYNLKFDYMGVDAMFPEKMEVLIGTDANIASMTKQLWVNEEIINYPYETASVNFTIPSSGVYYIAFRAFSDPDQFYLSLDNIKVSKENLSTQESMFSKLSFYPNPVKNVLNIDNEEDINNVSVFDLSGKLLITKVVSGKNVKLDLSSLKASSYMLRVQTKSGAKTIKIIKD